MTSFPDSPLSFLKDILCMHHGPTTTLLLFLLSFCASECEKSRTNIMNLIIYGCPFLFVGHPLINADNLILDDCYNISVFLQFIRNPQHPFCWHPIFKLIFLGCGVSLSLLSRRNPYLKFQTISLVLKVCIFPSLQILYVFSPPPLPSRVA